MANVDMLLTEAPPFHEDANGAPISWGLPPDVLKYLGEAARRGSRTLETGAGLSTVVLAATGAQHTCVVPDAKQVQRIRDYCASQGIALGAVQFEIGPSEAILPTLSLGELDLVLIDGRHGFPAPFIDFFYTARALKVGGLMVVDDTQLWTGRTLRDFLAEEAEWTRERDFAKTVVFRRVRAGGEAKEWNEQPFVLRYS